MRLYAIVLFVFVCFGAVGQDLVIKAFRGPITFPANEELTDTIVVANEGIVACYATVGMYLSKDDKLDLNDPNVSTASVEVLGAGKSMAFPMNKFGLNSYGSAVEPGVYTMFVVVDKANYVNETNEDNNQYVIPNFTVLESQTDMICSFTTNKSAYAQNDQVPVSFTMKNLNTSSNLGGYMWITFYLSTDQVLSNDDVVLNAFSRDFFGPDVVAGVGNVSLPATGVGKYYIIGRVNDLKSDPYNQLEETDMSNNTYVVGIDIVSSDIDLEITKIDKATYSTNPYEGDDFDLTFKIRNNGTTGVTGYSVKAYLSKTPVLTSEAFEGKVSFANFILLAAGGSDTFDGTVYSMGAVKSGSYYLFLEVNSVDSDKVIDENNRDNNIFKYPVMLVVPDRGVPKAKLQSASFREKYTDQDKELILNVDYRNTGTSASVHIYNTITITDNKNKIVYSGLGYGELDVISGTSNTIPFKISLDAPLEIGQYNVEIMCGSTECAEVNTYSLTLTIVPEPFVLSGRVVGETGAVLTKGKLFLYQKDENNVVKFTQSVTPGSSGAFSFSLDNLSYTLYFIPDAVAYPDYVPTVLGKTITLNDNSFITLTQNTSVNMEVLKLASWPTGSRVIRGNVVAGGEGSRIDIGRTEASGVAKVPVVLLSETGVPIRLTYTDNDGNYIFENLPAGNYEMFVCVALDNAIAMQEPVTVDATRTSVTVQLSLSQGGAAAIEAEPFYRAQAITFAVFEKMHYGDASFSVDATTDSGLPLTFLSSNAAVATVENGNVIIHSAGTADITASQSGDGDFEAAASVTRTLVVENVMGVEPVGSSIRLFPNPTTGILTIEGVTADDTVSVTDALGKQITTATRSGDNLDLRALPAGIYLLSLKHGSGVKVFRVVKE